MPLVYTSEYPIFYVTVDVVVLTVVDERLQVLAIRRGEPPYEGKWALPGGFVGAHENLRDAAVRELEEETGVRVPVLEQVGAYGDPERDPRYRVVSVAWLAVVNEPLAARAGSDAAHAEWRPVDELLVGRRLAFDHREILRDAVQHVRRLLDQPEAAGVAAAMMPPEFTLSEMRTAYEAVLGRDLDPGNFQRRVKKSEELVEPTGRRRSTDGGRGRPAELFRVRQPKA